MNPLLGGNPEIWRPLFLRVLRNTGQIRDAAEAVGLTPQSVRSAMNRDPSFAVLVDESIVDATELLETECRRRALAGSDLLLIFMLKALKPDKYRDKVQPDKAGSVINVKTYVGFSPDDWDRLQDSLPAPQAQIVDSTATVVEPSDQRIPAPALAD